MTGHEREMTRACWPRTLGAGLPCRDRVAGRGTGGDGQAVAGQPVPDFAALLRQLRLDAGLTQEELGEAAGLSPRTVSDLERGVHRSAHKDTSMLLARALRLSGPAHELFVATARGRAVALTGLAAAGEGLAAGDGPAADGRAASPAAALVPAAAPVPRELPADMGVFTGRAGELARLDLLLPRATGRSEPPEPVVVSAVSGTAGVGKTALAVHWAHRVAGHFPDGQLYVNLRGYDPAQPVTAGEALAGFLRALGMADQNIPLGEAERAARYRSLLAGKRLLVLLDNAATVEQVRPLLPGSGMTMAVITSRDSLAGLVARDGAHRVDLDLLPLAEAAGLLRTLIGDRAAADPVAAEVLALQCARLPLALRVAAELAASRPGVPLAELARELADEGERLGLLDAGGDSRGAVASVFSWSYRNLPPDVARVFRLLGLHPGPDWDRYAAAALTGTASVARTGSLLGVLARAHLVQPASPGRYKMHDLLRAYAAGLATEHDDDQARRDALTGLFDYYLAACAAAMDTLAPAERDQRPAAPPPEAALPGLGDRAAARAWLDAERATLAAVASHTAGPGWPGYATRLATTLYRYLYGSYDTDALTIHGHALAAARREGDRVAQAHMLANIGYTHDRQGRYDQAADCLQQSLALGYDTGNSLVQARAVAGLAIVRERQGRNTEAIDGYLEALGLFRELADHAGEVRQLGNLSGAYLRQGQYDRATIHAEQVLTLARQIDDQYWVARALALLGEISGRQERYSQADDYLRQAIDQARQIGHRATEATALTVLGEVRHRQGRDDQAAGHHQQALALYREVGDPSGEAEALSGVGEALLATGQPGQAGICQRTALTLARQIGDRYQEACALAGLGRVGLRQAEFGQALGCFEQALALYRELGNPGGEADALGGTGAVMLATGQPGQAHARLSAALALARRIGDRYQEARAHRCLAAACEAIGDPGRAAEHRQHALDIDAALGVTRASQTPADGVESCN
jgi:tetratricopeptide (TPR) repeat protein/transcriptional regulator with XRE-family HTH domain